MYTLVVLTAIGAQPIPAPRPVGGAGQTAADLGPWLPVGKDFVPNSYRGRIIDLTGKTMIVKPEGVVTIGEIKFLPGGIKEKRAYVQDNTQPPRTFVFSGSLLRMSGLDSTYRGAVAPLGGDHHKVGDLEVGDIVYIRCGRDEGVDYCYDVQIHRRPGGRVPPANEDGKLPHHRRWDTAMNAKQFVEEKVFPVMHDLRIWLLR